MNLKDKDQKSAKERQAQPNPLLRGEREKRGWSQDDVADKIGTTGLNVYRWENGRTRPGPYFRQKLCVLYDKSAVDLGFVDQDVVTPLRNVPYQQNLYYVGRETLMENLRKEFTVSKVAIPKQALSGLPGIGKTQTAVEYAYRYQEEYSSVLWVQADSEETLFTEMVRLAKILHLRIKDERDQESIVRTVKLWLDSNAGWLLILDNVQDPDMVASKLPLVGRGHMLLTTQAQAIGAFATIINIEKLAEEEGATFLLRRAKLIEAYDTLATASPNDKVKAREIAIMMDGMPLALDQAAAYIEETKCGVTGYLDRYKLQRAELLQRRGRRVSGHPDSVAATISLAFTKIAQEKPASAELLQMCAFLHAEDIPIDIFIIGAPVLGPTFEQIAVDPKLLDETIAELLDYSLVQRFPPGRLSIHRLVQAVLQDVIMDEQARQKWVERTVQAIAIALPPAETDIQRFEQYIPHAQSCVELIEQQRIENLAAAHIYSMTGFYLRVRALYDQAQAHCVQALALYEKLLGPEHPKVANSLNNLALVYVERGRHADAEPLLQRTLAILEKVLPPEDPILAGILHNLAWCYRFQGKLSQAERLSLQSLAVSEKALGPEHIDAAPNLTTLATIYRDQGKYSQAELHYLRALAIQEKELPPEHCDIAYSLNALATNYAFQRQFTRAEELNQRALTIFEKVRGIEHPDVALCLMCLSDSYFFHGEYDRAKQANQRALAIYEKVLRAEHPDAAQAISNLAILYEREGDSVRANEFYQRALAIRERMLGPEHPDLVPTLQLYARFLRKLGQANEAMKLEARAQIIRVQVENNSKGE
jgi:tetratricopeptide (TPR) repeat protein/transcriptional regulator with XRE-family HTH domain